MKKIICYVGETITDTHLVEAMGQGYELRGVADDYVVQSNEYEYPTQFEKAGIFFGKLEGGVFVENAEVKINADAKAEQLQDQLYFGYALNWRKNQLSKNPALSSWSSLSVKDKKIVIGNIAGITPAEKAELLTEWGAAGQPTQ